MLLVLFCVTAPVLLFLNRCVGAASELLLLLLLLYYCCVAAAWLVSLLLLLLPFFHSQTHGKAKVACLFLRWQITLNASGPWC